MVNNITNRGLYNNFNPVRATSTPVSQYNSTNSNSYTTPSEKKEKSISKGLIVADGIVFAGIITAALVYKNRLSKKLITSKLPDGEFRSQIAQAIGQKVENLKSVIGIQEFKELLGKLKPEDYKPGDNLAANLHIHTVHSDGKLKVEEVLNQAVEQAKKIKKIVIVSIADHDTLEGTREAIKIIAKDPEKYKDIKFIPGIEMSTRYLNQTTLTKEIQTETLGYGVNPFNKGLMEFIESRRTQNVESARKIIEEANKLESGINMSFEEAQSQFRHIEYVGSPGFSDNLKTYVNNKLTEKGVLEKHSGKIKEIFKTYSSDHKNLTKATPTLEEVVSIVKQSGGLAGIAHPAKIGLNNRVKSGVKGEEVLTTLIKDFNSLGGESIEYYYQRYDSNVNKWWQSIKQAYKGLDITLLRTGSMDTHGSSIVS